MNTPTAKTEMQPVGLVDAPRLLEILFPDESCRPSLRWLRDQTRLRTVPFVKIGRLVFFDPPSVRESMLTRHTVKSRRAA